MFVYSVKSHRSKLAAIALIAILVILGAVLCMRSGRGSRRSGAERDGVTAPLTEPEADAAASEPIDYAAADASERLRFIRFFGWTVKEEPEEIAEIVIPAEFDEVYEKYNAIQRGQGLDLAKHKGERVKRWSYAVTNYPGVENSAETVRIDLLVSGGNVIGGSVYSLAADGFMHGFEANTVQ